MGVIKLRIWDKKNKKMITSDNKSFGFELYLDGSFCVLERVYDDESGYIWITRDSDDFLIEQCTGHNDSGGAEVCAGDILYDGAYNREVIYDQQNLGWYIKRANGCMWELGGEYLKWNKVIGNIHENPELLKESE